MANYKRKKSRKNVRCNICTDNRVGNSHQGKRVTQEKILRRPGNTKHQHHQDEIEEGGPEMTALFVRFERQAPTFGQANDEEWPTYGPFEWAEVENNTLKVSKLDGTVDEDFAARNDVHIDTVQNSPISLWRAPNGKDYSTYVIGISYDGVSYDPS